jgi:hypothetical protein
VAELLSMFRMMTLVGVCLFVHSDQCLFVPRLLQLASDEIDVPSSLYHASRRGDQGALVQLSRYASAEKNLHWLKVTAEAGVADSFYQLAVLQTDHALHLKYLRLAANADHPKSQFELFLADERSTQQFYWLNKSALNDYQPAILALYHWHKLRGQEQQALPLLQKAAVFNGASAHILARQLWRSGQFHQAVETFQLASRLGDERAELYLNHIAWFQPIDNVELSTVQSPSNIIERHKCVTRLQFVSASIEAVVKSSDLIQQFSKDPRLVTLPLCINQPVWVKPSELSCSSSKSSGGRLSCELPQLSEIVDELDFSHLVVIGDSGKANVHNGIMYLDLADDYTVFVHELAHFAGFVDEYPLSKELAENICSGKNAPNLIFIDPNAREGGMPSEAKLLALNAQLFEARTCTNHPNHAYKMSKNITFMEFHDYGIIPDSYLERWREMLMNRTTQLPAALNFSQYFAANDADVQHNLWADRLDNFYFPVQKKDHIRDSFERSNSS